MGGVGQVERQVDVRRHVRVGHRALLGEHAGPGQLVGPVRGVEPGQLEDDPVDSGERGDRVAGAAVPGTGAYADRGHVEVEGGLRRGEQADGADQSGVLTDLAEQATARERVLGVVEGGQRRGVRVVLGGRAASAEPVLEGGGRARLGVLERQRGAAGALGDEPELGQRQRHPARQAVEQRGRRRGRGGEIDGGHSESWELDGEPVAVTGRGWGEGDQLLVLVGGGARDAVRIVIGVEPRDPGLGVGDEG